MSPRNDGTPMGDSERDAWLREALRHAPDADAAPPRDLSETILAQARAAARVGGAPARDSRRRNPVVALRDWLARPPVAAGFASVMAATLVGLMWWDRPMDETLPPRPEASVPRVQSAPGSDVGATAALPQPARQQNIEDATRRDNKVAAPAAKLQVPESRMPAAAPTNSAATDANAPQRKLEGANEANLADRAAAKPSPFPRSDEERLAGALGAAAKKKDVEARDDKSLDRAAKEAATDALAARDAPLAKSLPAPAPPTPEAALRSQPPAAFAGQRANEVAQTSPSANADSDAAKRARLAGAMSQTMPAAAAAESMSAPATPPPMAPAPPAAAAPPAAVRDAASSEQREKQAAAFAPPRQEQTRRSLGSAQREGATATPLAPILAALASDPSRWSRSTAAGNVVALEPGWRDWLAQLDAAARDRWQRSDAASERERDGAATLRLVDGGRAATVVRLDGTTVRVDAIDPGERWQATLPPAAAEQLRAAAERLGR
jgi:hypothetical protein